MDTPHSGWRQQTNRVTFRVVCVLAATHRLERLARATPRFVNQNKDWFAILFGGSLGVIDRVEPSDFLFQKVNTSKKPKNTFVTITQSNMLHSHTAIIETTA